LVVRKIFNKFKRILEHFKALMITILQLYPKLLKIQSFLE
jgi:hypothetical protein